MNQPRKIVMWECPNCFRRYPKEDTARRCMIGCTKSVKWVGGNPDIRARI